MQLQRLRNRVEVDLRLALQAPLALGAAGAVTTSLR